MKLSQLRGLLEKVAAKETPAKKTKGHKVMKGAPPCPGGKIRSKGMGRGLGRGKGRGPIGLPWLAKLEEGKAGAGKLASAAQIGFLAKCAELGASEEELVKVAALNWEAIWQALKNFGLGAGAAGKNVYRTGKGLVTGVAPHVSEMAKAPEGAAGMAGNIAGLTGIGGGALGLPFMAGRATAPEPEEGGLQELLERLRG